MSGQATVTQGTHYIALSLSCSGSNCGRSDGRASHPVVAQRPAHSDAVPAGAAHAPAVISIRSLQDTIATSAIQVPPTKPHPTPPDTDVNCSYGIILIVNSDHPI